MTTEHDEGFAAGIEAAAEVADDQEQSVTAHAIRNLKPAPRSAEPSAQGERERFEALLDSFGEALYRHEWCCDKKDALVAMFRAALATTPSTCSAEHTVEPVAQGERERFKTLVDDLIGACDAPLTVGMEKRAAVFAAYDALATAPSPRIEAEPVGYVPARSDEFLREQGGSVELHARQRGAFQVPVYLAPPARTPDARNVKEPAVSAFESLKAALQADPSYAWSWHCNLAMPIMDSIHCSSDDANKAGADLMRYLFDIDIRTHENWHHDPVGTPDARSTSDAAVGEDMPVLWYPGMADTIGAAFDAGNKRGVIAGAVKYATDLATAAVLADRTPDARSTMAAQSAADIRRAALEEAARMFDNSPRRPGMASAAAAIRALAALAASPAAPVVQADARSTSDATPQTGSWIAADDVLRNVKALDVALNGPGGATRPLLIDVLGQVEAEARRLGGPVLAHSTSDAGQKVNPLWTKGHAAAGFDRSSTSDAAVVLPELTEEQEARCEAIDDDCIDDTAAAIEQAMREGIAIGLADRATRSTDSSAEVP